MGLKLSLSFSRQSRQFKNNMTVIFGKHLCIVHIAIISGLNWTRERNILISYLIVFKKWVCFNNVNKGPMNTCRPLTDSAVQMNPPN